jgi:hypothetical protein
MKMTLQGLNPFAKKETKESILAAWEAADKALANAKENELNLRLAAIAAWYPDKIQTDEGTNNVKLRNGFKLKVVFKLNRTMADKDAVDAALTKIEKLGGVEGKILAERLVNWKPAIVKKEYDSLPEKYKKIINEVITEKPGTPSLEIVAPKAKK